MNPSVASVFSTLTASQLHAVATIPLSKRAYLANLVYMGIEFGTALALARLV